MFFEELLILTDTDLLPVMLFSVSVSETSTAVTVTFTVPSLPAVILKVVELLSSQNVLPPLPLLTVALNCPAAFLAVTVTLNEPFEDTDYTEALTVKEPAA